MNISPTSWLVLNLETRRLVRDPQLMEEGTVCTENAMETSADKVVMPKDVEPTLALQHTVAYSDVDMNAHTNNAMYMQWAIYVIYVGLVGDICKARYKYRLIFFNFNSESQFHQNIFYP